MKNQLIVPVGVITNEKGGVLITKRGEDESAETENKWELPGGTLEFSETPEETVVREVKEETGLNVEIIRLLPKIYTNLLIFKFYA
ncbi:MAG: NUDIX domain-containing protein [Patescibacteria group bacterium]|nr:NUDIX domain-containing protein [Patescibacteria group bacterium]